MTKISQPSVTVNRVSGLPIAGLSAQKILIIGQKTSAGSAIDGALVVNIGNDETIWNDLGGENSMATAMIRRARSVNPETQIDAIFLDDAGGATAAAGAIVIGGAATEDGTLTVVIASRNDFALIIPVVSGDSADAIGIKIEDQITASSTIPVIGVNTLGNVVTTAVNLGTYGNTFGLAVFGSVAGLTTGVTAMTGGATDPTLTGIFDVVGDERYQTILWPYADDLIPLTAFLDPRFSATDAILDGVGFSSKTDTLANLLTFVGAQNSPSVSVVVDKQESQTTYDGPAVLEIPVLKATEFGAIRALRGTTGASIGQFVVTNNSLDAFGGPASASKPYFNTPLPNLVPVDVDKGFDRVDIEQLLAAGAWVMGNNTAANGIISGEVVTTNTTDAAGNPDPTFTFLNFVDTSSNISEFYFNNLKSRYAQYRLTAGALIFGRDSANELLIRGFVKQLYQTLGGQDFALVQTGVGEVNGEPVDVDQFFDDNLTVSVDLTQGLVTITMVVPIIVQLRSILVPITIIFSPNS